jgi:hypothetical protein
MATERVPTEIWIKILRYAISVPLFLDTDPIEAYGVEAMIAAYDDPRPYYVAERTRNNLRRVCSAWNDYLLQFSNRYVRIVDLQHGHLQADAICSAIRLNLNTCSEESCEWPSVHVHILGIFPAGPKPWALEILEGELHGDLDLSQFQNRAPLLRTIMKRNNQHIEPVLELFPEISFVAVFGSIKRLIPTLSHSKLTTLSITMKSLRGYETWDLPSLRTFSFYVGTLDIEDFIGMIRVIGKELRVLYDMGDLSPQELLSELWNCCPNLEQFQTSFTWPSEMGISPSLRYIRLSSEILDEWEDMDLRQSLEKPHLGYFERIPIPALRKAGINAVGLDYNWWHAAKKTGLGPFIAFGLDHGLRLYDIRRVLFQDFVVGLIKVHWKGDKADKISTNAVDNRVFLF